MKSSYELAMERLNQSAPVKKLTSEQKEKIQDIEIRYRAKIAERETLVQGEIQEARFGGNREQADRLQMTLASEIQNLQEECESKKQRVRDGSD